MMILSRKVCFSKVGEWVLFQFTIFGLQEVREFFLISFNPLGIFFPTECPPFLRVEVVILHFWARGQKGAVCFECFSFSGRGLMTSYSGEFGEILCGFCQQIALSPFSAENFQPKQKSCKSLWHKGFYAGNKKVRIRGLTRTENL